MWLAEALINDNKCIFSLIRPQAKVNAGMLAQALSVLEVTISYAISCGKRAPFCHMPVVFSEGRGHAGNPRNKGRYLDTRRCSKR